MHETHLRNSNFYDLAKQTRTFQIINFEKQKILNIFTKHKPNALNACNMERYQRSKCNYLQHIDNKNGEQFFLLEQFIKNHEYLLLAHVTNI